jgi:glutathione S-transferase
MTHYALYYIPTCPFCQKVMQAMQGMNITDIEMRDKDAEPKYAEELIAATGSAMVPCLRIDNGSDVQWMHESDDIIRYLQQRG